MMTEWQKEQDRLKMMFRTDEKLEKALISLYKKNWLKQPNIWFTITVRFCLGCWRKSKEWGYCSTIWTISPSPCRGISDGVPGGWTMVHTSCMLVAGTLRSVPRYFWWYWGGRWQRWGTYPVSSWTGLWACRGHPTSKFGIFLKCSDSKNF